MLLADNESLDKAVKANVKEVRPRLMFDWKRDGQYDTPYVDFSDLIVSDSHDAQFTGQYPNELEINDGYAQRQITITIQGKINGIPVVTFFSPYFAYYGGSIGAINTPCKFFATVMSDDGPVDVPQLEHAYLVSAEPSRSSGTVQLTIADATSQLTNGINLDAYARSQAIKQYSYFGINDDRNDQRRQRGGTTLSWYMIDILRQSGLYQGPKPPPDTRAYWTLCGGVLPEVGGLWETPRDGRDCMNGSGQIVDDVTGRPPMRKTQQSYYELPRYVDLMDADTGYYPQAPWSPDVDSPSVYPLYMWERGKFGPAMKYDVYADNAPKEIGSADRMVFTGVTNEAIYSRSGNSGLHNRTFIGGWVKFDNAATQYNYTSVDCWLTGLQAATDSGNTAYAEFTVNPSLGVISMDVITSSTDWSASRTYLLPDGWHYIAGCLDSSGSTLKYWVNVDGNVSQVSWDSGSGNLPSFVDTYYQTQYQYHEHTAVKLSTTGGAQHWGIWVEQNSSSTPQQWSNAANCMDYEVRTDISPSTARVLWNEQIVNGVAWDTLKDLGSSDLGVIFTDETGVVRYRNWTEIVESRSDQANVVVALTLDDLNELNPKTTFSSVVNSVTYTSDDRWFVDDAVFRASDPQQFQVQSGGWTRYEVVTDDGCMSVMPHYVTPRRLAQGYWADWAGSGDNPNIKRSAQDSTGSWFDYLSPAFTPQDFMKAYGPDAWKNGYEGHNKGDFRTTDSGQNPLEGKGISVWAAPGWESDDWPDPRHLTIWIQSQNPVGGRTTMLAVDDNTAFLAVRGYKIDQGQQVTKEVRSTNAETFTNFGVRNIVRPATSWSTDYYTQYDLSQKLANDLAEPRPYLQDLEVRMDPRRQLNDVVRIDDGTPNGGIGGPIYAQVVGIKRSLTEAFETLTLRTFGSRGGAWVLGDSTWSVLGTTTILGDI